MLFLNIYYYFCKNKKAKADLSGDLWCQSFLKVDFKAFNPFFITIWFHEPHGPVNSDPKFVERYKRLNDPSMRQYLANVTQIDEAVGSIVNSLKEAGLYEDTMIWYTSDNGPEGRNEFGTFNKNDSPYGASRYRGSTGGLRGRKRHTHEGGIRVPGIISWPQGLKQAGVLPGRICAEPVIGSDVFPTMLETAGISIPNDKVLDSDSILPLIQGKAFERSRPLYWRNTQYKFQVAIRDRQWKIVANSQRSEFELYNLNVDPRETADLSKHYPQVFERMKAQLIGYDKGVLAEGPKWWQKEEEFKQSIPLK